MSCCKWQFPFVRCFTDAVLSSVRFRPLLDPPLDRCPPGVLRCPPPALHASRVRKLKRRASLLVKASTPAKHMHAMGRRASLAAKLLINANVDSDLNAYLSKRSSLSSACASCSFLPPPAAQPGDDTARRESCSVALPPPPPSSREKARIDKNVRLLSSLSTEKLRNTGEVDELLKQRRLSNTSAKTARRKSRRQIKFRRQSSTKSKSSLVSGFSACSNDRMSFADATVRPEPVGGGHNEQGRRFSGRDDDEDDVFVNAREFFNDDARTPSDDDGATTTDYESAGDMLDDADTRHAVDARGIEGGSTWQDLRHESLKPTIAADAAAAGGDHAALTLTSAHIDVGPLTAWQTARQSTKAQQSTQAPDNVSVTSDVTKNMQRVSSIGTFSRAAKRVSMDVLGRAQE